MKYLKKVLEIGVLVAKQKAVLLRHELSKTRIRFRRYFRYDGRVYKALSTQAEIEFDALFLKLTPAEKKRLIGAKGAGFKSLEDIYTQKYLGTNHEHTTD